MLDSVYGTYDQPAKTILDPCRIPTGVRKGVGMIVKVVHCVFPSRADLQHRTQ